MGMTDTRAAFHRLIEDDIELRALAEPDAADLFALTDKNRDHLRAWLPWVDGTRTIHDTRAFIRTAIEQQRDGDGFQAGIWHRGVLAGMVGYHRIDWPRRQVALGYWLGRDFEGKGFMTRACRVLVDHAFSELDLERVEIRAATENVRSRSVPVRLGFRQEGVMRRAEWLYDHFVDHAVYAISKEGWAALKQGPPSG
jgi:ribosomal-protein-serine acetyltransferase